MHLITALLKCVDVVYSAFASLILLLQCQNNIMCITDIEKHFLSASVLVRHNGLPSGHVEKTADDPRSTAGFIDEQAVSCCLFSTVFTVQTLYTVKTMTDAA